MKLTKTHVIVTTLLLVSLVLIAAKAQDKPTGPTLTSEQQAEFQQSQRNVVDAQKALDLAVSQRAMIVYKLRSEAAAPEKKFTARMDASGQLVFDAIPETAKVKTPRK